MVLNWTVVPESNDENGVPGLWAAEPEKGNLSGLNVRSMVLLSSLLTLELYSRCARLGPVLCVGS